MCYSLENFEYYYFKYVQFFCLGDVYVYYFGIVMLFFVDGIKVVLGDVFEIVMVEFGVLLCNGIVVVEIVLMLGWVVVF